MICGEPRWKGRNYSEVAKDHPMSLIIQKLQTSLLQFSTSATHSGCNALLEADLELADSLHRSCFGQSIPTPEKEKQWFHLGPEETFYLSHALKCLVIVGPDGMSKTIEELWGHMIENRALFPYLYKAYSHLRNKNWVVRPGLQYGADFVAYRHHPALVHSEYAVLVVAEDDSKMNHRLRTWSDWQCTLRVCGGVAKALLVISVRKENQNTTMASLSCLEQLVVEERIITRWVPELSREINRGDGESLLKKCSSDDRV